MRNKTILILLLCMIILLGFSIPEYAFSKDNTKTSFEILPIHKTFMQVIKDEEEEKARQEELERQKRIKAQESRRRLVYSAYTISNCSVKDFNKILAKTPLKGMGKVYYNLEQKYGVNGIYAIAVSGVESSYGANQCNTNNIHGFRKGSSGWMAFNSKTDCVYYFARLMNKPLYHNKPLRDIARIYCAQSNAWYRNVTKIMSSLWHRL